MKKLDLDAGIVRLDSEDWKQIITLAKILLPSWLESARFSGRGIQVFLLENPYAKIFGSLHEHLLYPPFLSFCATREREQDFNIPGFKEIKRLSCDATAEDVIGEIAKIVNDSNRMAEFRRTLCRRTNPEKNLSQGDGCFPSCGIGFDTYYYFAYFALFQCHKYTVA